MFTKFLSEEWPLAAAAAYANARLMAGSAILGVTYLEYPSDRQAFCQSDVYTGMLWPGQDF